MITLAYIDGKSGHLFFNNEDGIVFRSIASFKDRLNANGPDRFEGEIFGLNISGQPYYPAQSAHELAESMTHPKDCVLDVDATINLLRFRIIDQSLIENLRK